MIRFMWWVASVDAGQAGIAQVGILQRVDGLSVR